MGLVEGQSFVEFLGDPRVRTPHAFTTEGLCSVSSGGTKLIPQASHSLLSCVRFFATPWTVAHQAPLPMGFPRQEYWSGLPFPFPGDLPDPGIEPRSPVLQADSLGSEPPGKPKYKKRKGKTHTHTHTLLSVVPHIYQQMATVTYHMSRTLVPSPWTILR